MLIDLLGQVREIDNKDSTVSFKRKAFDSDDSLDLDNLDLWTTINQIYNALRYKQE